MPVPRPKRRFHPTVRWATNQNGKDEATSEEGNGNIESFFSKFSPEQFRSTFESNPVFEVGTLSLVLVSSLFVAVGTLPDLSSFVYANLNRAEDFITAIFAVEYVMRWYAAKEGPFSWKYVFTPIAIVDFIAILPLLLRMMAGGEIIGDEEVIITGKNVLTTNLFPMITGDGLINLRLLRLLRFQRVLEDMETFQKFEILFGLKPADVRPYQLQLARVIISIFTLVFVSTGLIYSAEHVVNPQIPDFFTALYFGLTTLTTVGFGDITPVTPNGRIVVGATILAGVAILPVQAASLVEALIDFQKERERKFTMPMPMDPQLQKEEYIRRLKGIYAQDSTKCLVDAEETEERLKDEYIKRLTDIYEKDFEECVMEDREKTDENVAVYVPITKYATGPDFAMTADVESIVRTCPICQAKPHRLDAQFCWSCGSNLPDWNLPKTETE